MSRIGPEVGRSL